jgi:hypothetical protein
MLTIETGMPQAWVRFSVIVQLLNLSNLTLFKITLPVQSLKKHGVVKPEGLVWQIRSRDFSPHKMFPNSNTGEKFGQTYSALS